MSRCNRCEKKTDDLLSVRKKGGGTFRRAPRQYPASICVECAKRLVETTV